MKSKSLSRIVLVASSCFTLLGTSAAFADYHVTAFGHTAGFDALLSKDASSAASRLEKMHVANMDFLELNNLCVSKILLKEFDSAISACSVAFEKADRANSLTAKEEKKAKASILSNMAVARAISGDTKGAKSDLEAALSLNAKDANANLNYGVLSNGSLAAEVAIK